jgi:hypothetical protein
MEKSGAKRLVMTGVENELAREFTLFQWLGDSPVLPQELALP